MQDAPAWPKSEVSINSICGPQSPPIPFIILINIASAPSSCALSFHQSPSSIFFTSSPLFNPPLTQPTSKFKPLFLKKKEKVDNNKRERRTRRCYCHRVTIVTPKPRFCSAEQTQPSYACFATNKFTLPTLSPSNTCVTRFATTATTTPPRFAAPPTTSYCATNAIWRPTKTTPLRRRLSSTSATASRASLGALRFSRLRQRWALI